MTAKELEPLFIKNGCKHLEDLPYVLDFDGKYLGGYLPNTLSYDYGNGEVFLVPRCTDEEVWIQLCELQSDGMLHCKNAKQFLDDVDGAYEYIFGDEDD